MKDSRDNFKYFDLRRLVTLTAIAIFVSGSFDLAHAQQRVQPTSVERNERYPEPAAGKDEILFRRIERNELDTIQFCRETVVFSLGLYQLGPLLTRANTRERSEAQALGGYYYRVLNGQGRHAPGGAKNYVNNGWITGGFALVAYPAEYRSSGVMTFIVNLDGIVYQKDLGPETSSRAKAMTEFDPDVTWTKVIKYR